MQSSRYAVMLDPQGSNFEAGIVSGDYQLVPNQTVCDIATDVLDRTGLDFDSSRRIFDGRKFQQRWVVPELHAEPEVGDIVQVAVDVYNSYDGSTTFGLAFNAQRLICTNGMILDFMLGGFRFKHWGNEGFQEELSQAASRIRDLGPIMAHLTNSLRRMISTPITRQDIQDSFRQIELPKTYVSDVFMALDGDNLWSLYNAFTDILTKQESFRAENWNRQVSRRFIPSLN
jgi:hypothetical protein